jgi:hypothetical protein
MPSIDELLAARAAAKPKPIEVTVLLDADTFEADRGTAGADRRARRRTRTSVSELMMVPKRVQAEVDAHQGRASDALVTFAFEKLPGDMWTDLTARNPPRPEALIDLNYGYNLDAVVKAAVKAERGGHHFAWQVDGDKNVVLTAEQWDQVFDAMYGHDMSAVRDAVWSVNEWQPSQKLAEAKKARAGNTTGSN